MRKFKLPIKYNTLDSIELAKLEIETTDFQVIEMTFYTIDNIEHNLDDDKCCQISSGGHLFHCTMSPKEVEEYIDNQLNK